MQKNVKNTMGILVIYGHFSHFGHKNYGCFSILCVSYVYFSSFTHKFMCDLVKNYV